MMYRNMKGDKTTISSTSSTKLFLRMFKSSGHNDPVSLFGLLAKMNV